MSKEISLDRKKFLGAAAGGAAAVAASGPWVARAFSGTSNGASRSFRPAASASSSSRSATRSRGSA